MKKAVKNTLIGFALILISAGATYMVKLLDWSVREFFPNTQGWMKFGIPIGIILLLLCLISLAGIAFWRFIK